MDQTFSLAGKRVTVTGIGISNRPLIDFLLDHGAVVTARDMKSREKLMPFAQQLAEKGVRLICGPDYLEGIDEDIIFRSPGIRYDKPQFAAAQARGAVLTSEMELFFDLCPAPIIGITGSDGKTTTTTLIAKMLEAAGHKVYLGGNIGKPLLQFVGEIRPEDYAVVELSSFQLHTMKRSPDIAVVTNVAPNHLDYHTDMEEYIDAKRNILRNPGIRKAVLNYGNAITRSFAGDVARGVQCVFFAAPEGGSDLVCERDGAIFFGDERILPLSEINLPGHHNVENYMAAIGALHGIVPAEVIRQVAREFGGVEHRIELVREKDGVKYYNSSIDSSPTRTTAALTSFSQKVIVICGGYDKHIPFNALCEPLCRCAKTVVLTGATAGKIKAALDQFVKTHPEAIPPEVIEEPLFDEAVAAACRRAAWGDIVILSPACASFDAFPNFEARGRHFKELIQAL